MELSGGDCRSLLEIVDLAYNASCPDSLLLQLFENLKKTIGINSAVYLPMGERGLQLKGRGSIVFHSSAQQAQEYAEYYSPLDPFVATGWFNDPNRAVRNTDLFPATKLANSEFAIDFLSSVPCFWIIAASLGAPGHLVGVMGLHRLRHERGFSDRDVAFMNTFLPHVSRALLMFEHQNQRPRATGIVILDEKGTAVFLNEAAMQILNGKLPEVIPLPISQSPVLQDRTIYQSDRGNYAVGVRSIPYHYKVISLEPLAHDGLPSRLALLGLTPRQQEIALRVLRGLCNKAIAKEFNLTEQTVKDHVNAIFQKLGIHHRAELAARVLPVTME